MKLKKWIPWEGLKLLACATMLIDHIGAFLIPNMAFRAVGRLAFPIYCFLLVQGIRHTRDPWKYLLRMAICAVASELPYDMLIAGGPSWAYQSVMVTLCLGLCMGISMEKMNKRPLKFLLVVPFVLLAELLNTDYGGYGILMIALFLLVDTSFWGYVVLLGGMLLINWRMSSAMVSVLGIHIPIQILATGALLPIAMYSGEQLTHSRTIKWAFFVFYPVHLLVLWLICCWLR